MAEEIDVALGILDHQLLDAEERRCGNVDDLALEGGPGEELEVTALLSGPGVLRSRAPLLGRLVSWIGGDARVRVPWTEVREVGPHVQLRKKAADYGLGRGDDRLRTYIEKIPGAGR